MEKDRSFEMYATVQGYDWWLKIRIIQTNWLKVFLSCNPIEHQSNNTYHWRGSFCKLSFHSLGPLFSRYSQDVTLLCSVLQDKIASLGLTDGIDLLFSYCGRRDYAFTPFIDHLDVWLNLYSWKNSEYCCPMHKPCLWKTSQRYFVLAMWAAQNSDCVALSKPQNGNHQDQFILTNQLSLMAIYAQLQLLCFFFP